MSKFTYLALILCTFATSDVYPQLVNNEQAQIDCQAFMAKPKDIQTKTYNYHTCNVMRMQVYFKTIRHEYINLGDCGQVRNEESLCGSKEINPKMIIDFPCGSLIFDFALNENNSTSVKSIAGHYFLAGVKNHFQAPSTSYFKTSQPEHSYNCEAEQNVTLDNGDTLFVAHFTYEVFRNPTSLDFYQVPDRCLLDKDWSISVIIGMITIIAITIAIICIVVRYRHLTDSID